jgi:DNA-binding transcriptional ArsR family regulator
MKERRDVFFAIADENRRAILEKLAFEKGNLSVGTIASNFKVSRNAISKHIIVLKESGLVTTEYIGRENMVSIDAHKLAEVYQWISLFEEFWKGKLNNLKRLVESKNKGK